MTISDTLSLCARYVKDLMAGSAAVVHQRQDAVETEQHTPVTPPGAELPITPAISPMDLFRTPQKPVATLGAVPIEVIPEVPPVSTLQHFLDEITASSPIIIEMPHVENTVPAPSVLVSEVQAEIKTEVPAAAATSDVSHVVIQPAVLTTQDGVAVVTPPRSEQALGATHHLRNKKWKDGKRPGATLVMNYEVKVSK